jgi:hypothetical protein
LVDVALVAARSAKSLTVALLNSPDVSSSSFPTSPQQSCRKSSVIPSRKKKGPQAYYLRPLGLKVSTSRGEQLAAFDTGGGTNKAAAVLMMTDGHREFKAQRTIKRL